MKKLIYIAICSMLVLSACSKPKFSDYQAKGIEYFPYNVGSERYYNVDSTVYNGSGGPGRKVSFRIRETVTEKFIDAAGNEAVRIEQYISRDNEKSWDFFALTTANWDGYGVQWVENNTRYFIMSFPIRNLREWNGNLYNQQDDLIYKFSDVDAPFSEGPVAYSNTVTVVRENTVNLFFDIVFIEKYAKGYGLVYKKRTELEHQDTANPAKQIGYELVWHLTEYIP